MECPRGSVARSCEKSVTTQTCACYSCAELNHKVCGLCGLRIPAMGVSNDQMLAQENTQVDTCQCFVSPFTVLDVPHETSISNELNAQFPTNTLATTRRNLETPRILNPEVNEESLSHIEVQEEKSQESKKSEVKYSTKSTTTPELSNSTDCYVSSSVERNSPNFNRGTVLGSTEKDSCRRRTVKKRTNDPRKANEGESESTSAECEVMGRSKNVLKGGKNEGSKHKSENKDKRESTLESEVEGDSEYTKRSTEKSINDQKLKTGQDSSNSPVSITQINSNQNVPTNVNTSAATSYAPVQENTYGFNNFNITDPFLPCIRPMLPQPFPRYYQAPLPIPVAPTNIPGRFLLPSAPRLIVMRYRPPVDNQHARQRDSKARLVPTNLGLLEEEDANLYRQQKKLRIQKWLSTIENPLCNSMSEEHSIEEYEETNTNPTFFVGSKEEVDRSSTEIYSLEEELHKPESSQHRKN